MPNDAADAASAASPVVDAATGNTLAPNQALARQISSESDADSRILTPDDNKSTDSARVAVSTSMPSSAGNHCPERAVLHTQTPTLMFPPPASHLQPPAMDSEKKRKRSNNADAIECTNRSITEAHTPDVVVETNQFLNMQSWQNSHDNGRVQLETHGQTTEEQLEKESELSVFPDEHLDAVKSIKRNDPDFEKLSQSLSNLSDKALQQLGSYVAKNDYIHTIFPLMLELTDAQMAIFFKAASNNSKIEVFDLDGDFWETEIGVQFIQSFIPFLENVESLSTFKADRTKMTDDGFERIIRALHRGNAVEELVFSKCCINDISPLEKHPLGNLKYLSLGGNNIGVDGCKTVSKLPNSEYLNLEENKINNDGCEVLAELLQNDDCKLETLYISCNEFNDEGVRIICDGLLRGNETLKCLSLHSTFISDRSHATLSKLVYDGSSVKSVLN